MLGPELLLITDPLEDPDPEVAADELPELDPGELPDDPAVDDPFEDPVFEPELAELTPENPLDDPEPVLEDPFVEVEPDWELVCDEFDPQARAKSVKGTAVRMRRLVSDFFIWESLRIQRPPRAVAHRAAIHHSPSAVAWFEPCGRSFP